MSLAKTILGTAKFGMNYGTLDTNRVSPEEVRSILERASEVGINRIDTASSYGVAERLIGASDNSSRLIISKITVDKFGKSNYANQVQISVRNSLSNLKVDRLHAVLFHNTDDLFEKNGEKLYRSALSLRDEGLVNHIGCSVYTPEELQTVISSFDFEFFQLPLNVLDRRFLDSGLIESLSKSGKEVHIRSVFLKGLLLRTSGQYPSWMSTHDNSFAEWQSHLVEHQLNPVQTCLDFAHSIEGVSGVVVGVSSLIQLNEIVSYGKNRIQAPVFSPSYVDPMFFDPRKWS